MVWPSFQFQQSTAQMSNAQGQQIIDLSGLICGNLWKEYVYVQAPVELLVYQKFYWFLVCSMAPYETIHCTTDLLWYTSQYSCAIFCSESSVGYAILQNCTAITRERQTFLEISVAAEAVTVGNFAALSYWNVILSTYSWKAPFTLGDSLYTVGLLNFRIATLSFIGTFEQVSIFSV